MTAGFEQIIFLNVRFWFRCGCQMGVWGIMSCGEGELTFEEGHTHSNAHTTNRPVKFYFKNFINCFLYIIKRISPGFYFLNIEI